MFKQAYTWVQHYMFAAMNMLDTKNEDDKRIEFLTWWQKYMVMNVKMVSTKVLTEKGWFIIGLMFCMSFKKKKMEIYVSKSSLS